MRISRGILAILGLLSAQCAVLARPPLQELYSGRDLYRRIVSAEALRNGVPLELVHAVISVESAYDPLARGRVGEVGLMQVRPSTAALMGFSGSVQALGEPETNIAYGARYLAEAWRLAGEDICTTVMKYRAGHAETRFSQLSVDYCQRVRASLRRTGFEVTGAVPSPTVGIGRVTKLNGGRIRVRFPGAGTPFARPVRVAKNSPRPDIKTYCKRKGGGAKRVAGCIASENGARLWLEQQRVNPRMLYQCNQALSSGKSGYVMVRGCILAKSRQ
jgi:hypothetical protein